MLRGASERPSNHRPRYQAVVFPSAIARTPIETRYIFLPFGRHDGSNRSRPDQKSHCLCTDGHGNSQRFSTCLVYPIDRVSSTRTLREFTLVLPRETRIGSIVSRPGPRTHSRHGRHLTSEIFFREERQYFGGGFV